MECYTSKRKGIGMILFWIVTTILSGLAATLPDIVMRVLGSLLAALFAAMLVLSIRRLFDSHPQLVINDAGIVYRRSWIGGNTIPWNDIRGLYLWQSLGNTFLAIDLENREKYASRLLLHKQRLMVANARAHYPDIAISFQDLTPSLDKVAEYLRLHHGEKLSVQNGS